MSLKPQPLCLQGYGAAAGKGVVEGGELVRVEQLHRPRMVPVVLAGTPPTLANFLPRRFQDRLVGGVLPLHQLLDNAEQPLPLLGLGLIRGKQLRSRGRIVHQLSEEHCSCRRERTPCPPKV